MSRHNVNIKSIENIDGQMFGRWSVIRFSHLKPPHRYFVCRCECGTEKVVQGNSLTSGTTRSCGCLRRERSRENRLTHGMSSHPMYLGWEAMKRRCASNTPATKKIYKDRGIVVCERWKDSFEAFRDDMGPKWAPGLTLDRIDNEKGYEPSNCRWATASMQARNKRINVYIETPWGTMLRADAAARAGISVGALIHRMQNGWPQETWFLPSTRAEKAH